MTTPSTDAQSITIDIDDMAVIENMTTLVPLELVASAKLTSQGQRIHELTSQAQRTHQPQLNIGRALVICGTILCETPFIVSDLVYGYSTSECITSKLHTYYVVSAYVSLAICAYGIAVMLSLREVLNSWIVSCSAIFAMFLVYGSCVVHILWDIYGVYCLYYVAPTCLHNNGIMYGYVSVAIKLITGICVTMYFTINLMVT